MADIIQIGDLRVERQKLGLSNSCPHKHISYDSEREEILCHDCELIINNFKAFVLIVEKYNEAVNNINQGHQELKYLETFINKPLLQATRLVERAWRSKNMVPCCPHCHRGILIQDGLGGSCENIKFEIARRRKQ